MPQRLSSSTARLRALPLVNLLNENTPVRAGYVPWEETYAIPPETDVVVNTTSIGLYPDPNKPDIDYDTIMPAMVVCDIIPNPPQTGASWIWVCGAKTLDGLGMLVYQGAIGFKLWTGHAMRRWMSCATPLPKLLG